MGYGRKNNPIIQIDNQELKAELAQNTQDLEYRGFDLRWNALMAVDGDWTNALQSAIDNVQITTILIHGSYKIGGVMVDRENLTFKGRTKADKLTVKKGTLGIHVKQNKVNFYNLSIVSEGSKNDVEITSGILYEKTPARSIGFSEVNNVDLHSFSGYGLKVVNAIQFAYNGGYVNYCMKGIFLDRDSGGVTFGTTVYLDNIYLTGCDRGIDAHRIYRSSFKNIIGEYCNYGIYARVSAFTLYRSYFEKCLIKGVYAEDCEMQDLFTYENNTTTDAVQRAFTSASLPNDRGYTRMHKDRIITKRLSLLSNYGVDPKEFAAYGNSNNIGLKYGDNIVPLIRGDNLLNPSAWVSNRMTEFQGYDQSKQGYKVQGTTAGDNTYGIKQTVTLDNTKQYVIDVLTATLAGSGLKTIRCGSLVVANGVPFTPPANGNNEVKVFGVDVAGTPFECYVHVFSLSEVVAQEKYTPIAQDKLSSKQPGRGIIHMSAPPTTGGWSVGEIIYNSNPTAGGYLGWVCVNATGSGTWKGFGLIES